MKLKPLPTLALLLSFYTLPSCNLMQKQHQRSVEQYIRAYNQFDIEGMLAQLHPDIVFQNISEGEVSLETKGLEAFREQAEEAQAFFSEREQTVTSWSFRQDTVTVGIRYRAVLAKDLPNGLRRGDPLQLDGESEFVFKGDKIIRLTDRS